MFVIEINLFERDTTRHLYGGLANPRRRSSRGAVCAGRPHRGPGVRDPVGREIEAVVPPWTGLMGKCNPILFFATQAVPLTVCYCFGLCFRRSWPVQPVPWGDAGTKPPVKFNQGCNGS